MLKSGTIVKLASIAFATSIITATAWSLQDATPPSTETPPDTEAPTPPKANMSLERLDAVVKRIDPEATRENNTWRFTLVERPVFLVTDPAADRMRVMSPVAQISALGPGMHERMLQANFDAALDARYAIAQNLVWSVFIHPLGSLTERDLLSGTAQTVTAAINFGTSYSSGGAVYGGGDTNGILRRELLDELLKREGTPL